MARILFTLIALLCCAAPAAAQRGVAWDHDGIDVGWFEVRVDGVYGDAIDAAKREWMFPRIAAGRHDISVAACNGRGCSEAVSVEVVCPSGGCDGGGTWPGGGPGPGPMPIPPPRAPGAGRFVGTPVSGGGGSGGGARMAMQTSSGDSHYYRTTGMPSSASVWTAMVWVRFNSTGYSPFLNFGYGGTAAFYELAGEFGQLVLWNGGANSGGGAIEVGVWYPAALVANGTDIRAYLNGDLVITHSLNGGVGASRIEFGGTSYPGEDADVSIAYGRMWNVALSEAEIEAEMASETPVRTDDLLGDFPFTNASNWGEDLSSTGIDLEPAGSAGTEVEGPGLSPFQLVQSGLVRNTDGSTNPITVTLPGVAADSLMVAFATAYNPGVLGSTAVTYSGGSSWDLLLEEQTHTDPFNAALYYDHGAPGGDAVVRLAPTSGRWAALVAAEFETPATVAADTAVSAEGTGPTISITGSTPASSDNLAILVLSWYSDDDPPTPSGWKLLGKNTNFNGAGGSQTIAAYCRIQVSATAPTATTSIGASVPWVAVIGSISADAGGTTVAYTGQGGVTIGGGALFSFTRAHVGVGGVDVSGAASVARQRVATAAGGAVVGGTASTARTRALTGNGGAVAGGEAAVLRTRAVTGAGGVALGGAATVQTSSGSAYIAQGGVRLGGSATIVCVRAAVGAGGCAVGGAASTTRTRVAQVSGGVVLSGAATASRARATIGAGGVVAGGSASVTRQQTAVSAGGVELNGTAGVVRQVAHVGDGGVRTGGAATARRVVAAAGQGSVTLSGAAAVTRQRTHISAGGIVVGGTAGYSNTAGTSYTGQGGVRIGGSALVSCVRTMTASGGVTLGGAAVAARTVAIMPAGGVSWSGGADVARARVVMPAGGVTLSGAASFVIPELGDLARVVGRLSVAPGHGYRRVEQRSRRFVEERP